LPVRPGGRGVAIVKLGLSFYDFVTRKSRRTPRHHLASRAKSLQAIPALNPSIVATATYWDARITQAERLCIEMLHDACAANPNCHALNYVRLLPVSPGDAATHSGYVVPPYSRKGGVRSSALFTKRRSSLPEAVRAPTSRQEHPEQGTPEGSIHTPPEGGTTYPTPPRGGQGGILTLQDEVTGQQFSVEPQIVVNATGAWVDSTNALFGLETRFIGGTKGSHLVVDNRELYETLGGQMVYYEHKDGRICIVFPFGDKVLMGSTDIRTDDPETARCDEAEIDYMLATLRGVFPGLSIRRDQIVYTFCGVRPLPAGGRGITGKITRGHSIRVIEPDASRPFPIFSLIGGKWTTFRAFAEQVADQLLPRLGLPRRCSTHHTPIGGGKGFPLFPGATREEERRTSNVERRTSKSDAAPSLPLTSEFDVRRSALDVPGAETREKWIARVAGQSRLAPERVATLLARYGTAAEACAIAEGTSCFSGAGEAAGPSPEGQPRMEPGAAMPPDRKAECPPIPLASLPDYTIGEIQRIAANEQVVHLTDLVCRRSTIALLGRATPPALRELAEIVGPVLGWDDARKEEEVRRATAT